MNIFIALKFCTTECNFKVCMTYICNVIYCICSDESFTLRPVTCYNKINMVIFDFMSTRNLQRI